MAIIRSIAILSLILFLAGCGDPKPPTRDNRTSGSGDDTVYGSGDSRENLDDMKVSDMIIEEDPVVYEADRLDTDPVDTGSRRDLNLDWEPVFFEFDRATLSPEARQVLRGYAEILQDQDDIVVLLEGHCDIRGTEEYNMGLGERRAQQVKRYLVELGVSALRLKTISYGELRPLVDEESEAAWARNRRVSFTF